MKKYEYKDKIYCDIDLSCEIDNYGGDTYDLYFDLQKDNLADETTWYHTDCPESLDDYYDSIESLIENKFDDLIIGDTDNGT